MAAKKAKRTLGTGGRTNGSAAGGSDVEAFLASKAHPLEAEIHQLRKLLLAVSPVIREEIKWNSISFRNENDFFATVNLRSTAALQVILYTGVKKKATALSGVPVEDPSGLIEKWPAKDRCIVGLGKGRAVKANQTAFEALVKAWIQFVD